MEAQLRFTIKNQIIQRIDEFEVVEKSKNYLRAHFDFETEEWEDKIKTALFKNGESGTTYCQILDESNECTVPYETLRGDDKYLYVSVYAGNLITVNVVKVFILKSGYIEGETPEDPSPTVYDEIISRIETIEAQQSIENLREYIKKLLAHCPNILYKTTAEWDEGDPIVSETNALYVYTDHIQYTIDDETIYYSGLKVGDGESLVSDLQFVGEYRLNQHIADMTMHVSQSDRISWNSKVSVSTDPEDDKMLVLSIT